MLKTLSTSNYNRTDMAAILTSLPREEQQWTWNFLNSIILIQSKREVEAQKEQPHKSLPITSFVASLSKNVQLPADINEKEEYHKHLMEKYG